MKDVDVVKSLEASGHLDESLPDFSLIEVSSVFEVLVDLLLDISSIG